MTDTVITYNKIVIVKFVTILYHCFPDNVVKSRIFPLSEQNCLEVETAPRLTWSRPVGVNLGTG